MNRQTTTQIQQKSQAVMPVSNNNNLFQRKCACGQHTMKGECEEYKKKRASLQRSTQPSHKSDWKEGEPAPPIVQDVLSSPGQSLDLTTREFFNTSLGHDFSFVRVHTDAYAAESARAVNAHAYTVGGDVVFDEKQFRPQALDGRLLLAHELTHVLQQQNAPAENLSHIATGSDSVAEQEADRMAGRVSGGKTHTNAQPLHTARSFGIARMQRQPSSLSPQSDANSFTDAPIEDMPDLEPLVGESLDAVLKPNTLVVVEFGSTNCEPCKTLSRILKQEYAKLKKSKNAIRFYSVDVDKNPQLGQQYAPQGELPQLYVYFGNAQKFQAIGQESANFYAQLFANILAESSPKEATEKGKMGIPLWQTVGLFAGGGLALAGGGLFIADKLFQQSVSTGAAMGILGAGLAVGAVAGWLDPFGLSKRTQAVGAKEADTLIHKYFGTYLEKKEYSKPLHDAQIQPVTQLQLQANWQCRHPEEKKDLSNLIGWTDQGPEKPAAPSSKQKTECKLEPASFEKPVIYYAYDRPDATVLIHEGLHAYAHPDFSGQLRNFPTEGAAEYFTQQIAREIGLTSSSGYGGEIEEIKKLVEVIGEEALRKAYFQGDFSLADKVLGCCGLETWGQNLSMKNRANDESNKILKNRKGDYCP